MEFDGYVLFLEKCDMVRKINKYLKIFFIF